MTCLYLSIATFAFRMSKQRRVFPLGLRAGTTGFSHVVFPGAGSMMSRFCNRWSSSDTFCLVC